MTLPDANHTFHAAVPKCPPYLQDSADPAHDRELLWNNIIAHEMTFSTPVGIRDRLLRNAPDGLKNVMKLKITFALTIAAIVVTGIITGQALAVMTGNMSMHQISTELAERVSARIGAPVTLKGEPELTGFPLPRITTENVMVAGADSQGTSTTITIPRLEVSLRMLPLLLDQVEVERLTLIEPEIRIAATARSRNVSETGGAESSLQHPVALLEELGSELSAFEIRDATFIFESPQSNRVETVRNADFSAFWSKTEQSVSLSGTAEWRDAALDLDAELAEPTAAMSEEGSQIRLSLSARQRTATAIPDTEGSPPAWSSCLLPLAPDQHIGPIEIDGALRIDDGRVSLSDADFRFNGGEGSGNLAITRSGNRPKIEGSVKFKTLNLFKLAQAYLPRGRGEDAGISMKTPCLEAGDAALSLSAKELRVGQIQMTDVGLDLETRQERVDFDLRRATLADGSIAVDGSIETAGQGVTVKLGGRITDLSVTELSQTIWPIYRSRHPIGIESPPRGIASAEFQVSTTGATPAALRQGLEGQGELRVRNGSIDGANIVATLDRLKEGNKIIAKGKAPFVPVPGRTHFLMLTTAVVAKDGTVQAERARMAGEEFEIELTGEMGLDGGLMVAVGTASLFSEDEEPEQRDPGPTVELPFGVGGSVLHPGIAPGIPRIGPRADAAPSSTGCSQPQPNRCSRRL